MSIDRIAYIVRSKVPWLFNVVERLATEITVLRHSRRRRAALKVGCLSGTVQGCDATVRPIRLEEAGSLSLFFEILPEEYLTFFHPHSFSPRGLRKVLESEAFCCYGVFINDEIKAYGLIKLFPTRNAYIGRLVAPDRASQGIGKFLSRYLCWQSSIIQVTPSSTIHKDNLPSLASHKSVRKVVMADELPNGYVRVVYPQMESDSHAPELSL